jgi:hypothetical protein
MMTILKYEYTDVIKPHPFFPTIIERELARRGLGESRRVLFYMPGNFSSMPRILDEIGIDAFVVMVAPMGQGRILQLRDQRRLHNPDRAQREAAYPGGESADAARIRRLVGSHLRSGRDRRA